MRLHTLTRTTILPRPLQEVFDFFSRAENLNLLTPPDVHFRFITPVPVEMKQGRIIDYHIRINGIPFKWRTEISAWEPPYRFADRQVIGPYAVWIHEHRFEDAGNGTTRMTDTVQYRAKGWILEPLIHRFFVRQKVEQIFDYRETQLKKLLM